VCKTGTIDHWRSTKEQSPVFNDPIRQYNDNMRAIAIDIIMGSVVLNH